MSIVIPELHFNIYGMMLILSLFVGFCSITVILFKRSMPKWLIASYVSIGIFMCVYCGLMLTYIQNGFKGFFWQAGLSSMGGAIGILISAFTIDVIFKFKYRVLDAQIRVLPLIYSIAKIGCLFAGCCRGVEHAGILSITYERLGNVSYFPIQLIETITFAIIFIVGITILRGVNAVVIVAISMLMKTLLDFFRLSNGGKFGFTQSVCVFVAVVMIIGSIVVKRKYLAK